MEPAKSQTASSEQQLFHGLNGISEPHPILALLAKVQFLQNTIEGISHQVVLHLGSKWVEAFFLWAYNSSVRIQLQSQCSSNRSSQELTQYNNHPGRAVDLFFLPCAAEGETSSTSLTMLLFDPATDICIFSFWLLVNYEKKVSSFFGSIIFLVKFFYSVNQYIVIILVTSRLDSSGILKTCVFPFNTVIQTWFSINFLQYVYPDSR
jgi:hypothetical protein